jgi:hypothetical protein
LTDACIASDSTAKTNLDENPRPMFKLGVLTAVVNVWYLSFHGGTERYSRNNIHIYSAAGEELGKALNRKSLPDNIELRELRGFGFGPDRHLYVVNAYREASQIFDSLEKPIQMGNTISWTSSWPIITNEIHS